MGFLWLIGMMGAGKSAVGREVARRAGVEFVDTDEEVAARAGCSIGELWGSRGEQAFRDLEAAQVERLADSGPCVVATGGGAVLRPESIEAMRRSGTVVWLQADPVELAARVEAEAEQRPLLAGAEAETELARILAERTPLYRQAAHHVVATGGRPPVEVAELVAKLWIES